MKAAINQIIELTAEEFGVMPRAITGRNKSEAIQLPRMAALQLAWKHVGCCDTTIGHFFDGRQGCAVARARKLIPALLETNKAFRNAYEKIESKIKI